MTSPRAFTENDYPALYLAAEHAATAAQKRHARMTAIILGALVTSACLSALGRVFPSAVQLLALLTAAGAALSFTLTTMRRSLRPEKRWFAARSVAEAAKSRTWLFLTRVDPYPSSLTNDDAIGKFLADLRSTVEDEGSAAVGFGGEFSDHRQITPRMRELRLAPLEERRDLYVSARIQDQRKWYSATATRNQTRAAWFHILIQLSQALALGASGLLLLPSASAWDLGGVFSALASALIAWDQMRRYDELVQSYAMTALDLGLIEERAETVSTESELARFVTEAETVLSRERGTWIARRT